LPAAGRPARPARVAPICAHLRLQQTQSELYRCAEYKRLTGKIGNCIRKSLMACKYYEAKQ
jgi:hypothetical protein